jgi:tungstate transport system ATP-binding protein
MTFNVELRNITKNFNGITALDNVSLEIHEGEILGLLGPNGAGKTTLMRILALIEKPSKGEVYFCGKKITNENIDLMRSQTTMIFQRTILFSTNVYNNVAYGLTIRKVYKNKIDEEVHKALRLVKLEGFEKRQAKKLSGGEQQRVALARALVLNTKLLLLDEPTANLDPKNASIIEEVISTVNRESKTTVVIATHNMFQAKNLPQRIALITNGKIVEVGTPTEIFGRLSKTLASFATVENTFTGTAKVTEDGTTIVDIGNGVQIQTTARGAGKVSVFISPEDIILSKARLTSSARNIFKGKIVEISDLGSVVRLKVDVRKPLTVQVTKRSFNEMGLNLNAEVFLAFKASSVQII